MDDFYEYYASDLTKAGSPLLYYFESGQFKAYPIPSASDSVLVKYVKVPTELIATSVESAINWPKRYHRSVLGIGTLSRLAVMQDDAELGASYERLYEKALATMVDDVFHQQSQRPDFIHVNDPDNWDYS
jgi:proline racemase